jgi:hypothetical protein
MRSTGSGASEVLDPRDVELFPVPPVRGRSTPTCPRRYRTRAARVPAAPRSARWQAATPSCRPCRSRARLSARPVVARYRVGGRIWHLYIQAGKTVGGATSAPIESDAECGSRLAAATAAAAGPPKTVAMIYMYTCLSGSPHPFGLKKICSRFPRRDGTMRTRRGGRSEGYINLYRRTPAVPRRQADMPIGRSPVCT